MLQKIVRSVRCMLADISRTFYRVRDWRSFFRYAADTVLIRLRSFLPAAFQNTPRCIILQDGSAVHYRFNWGDIWTIREICLYDAYRLPQEMEIKTVVDLGANIGLCSVWLAKRHHAAFVLSVEPDPDNCRFAEMNLAARQCGGALIYGAAGARDALVRFDTNESSNFGSVQEAGNLEVQMYSMQSILQKLPEPDSNVDLLKVDIEGGEEELFTKGDLSWLRRVRAIIIEIHPEVVDPSTVIEALEGQGFRYFPAGSVFPEQMDFFLRES